MSREERLGKDETPMLDQNVAREVLQEAVRTGGDFAEIFMEDRIDHAMGDALS